MIFKNKEKGNVLFLILIAVALFAALSYAVTQSSRSGGDASRETTILNSAQITQYPNQVRTAILRLVIDGRDITDLQFNTPGTGAGTFGAAGFEETVAVFHPNGGGAVFQSAPVEFVAAGSTANANAEWFYNLEFEIPLVGLSEAGLGGNDLIAFLPDVTLALCQRINAEAGITTASAAPPVLSGGNAASLTAATTNMADTYTLPTTHITIDDGSNSFDGQPFGCYQNTASGEYVYYHTVFER